MLGSLALEESTMIGGFVIALVLAFLRFGDDLIDRLAKPSSVDAITESVLEQDE